MLDMPIEAATKALLYAAVLQTVGAAAALWVAMSRVTADVPAGRRAAGESIRWVGLRASAVVVLALLLRGWAHTAATFGFARSISWEALSTIVIESRWGRSWEIQMLAALASVVAYAWIGSGRRGRCPVTAVTSGALVLALTRTGHAAGDLTGMAIHTAHVVGGGVWLGTLATLVSVRRSLDQELSREVFRAFSRFALTGAAVLVAAGVVASCRYVGSFGNLWITRYGRVLLIKVALVCGVVACGYVNWRAIESGRSEPGRAAIIELALTASVIAVTGVLTELEHP
jgi:putative copper export protein